MWSIYTLSSYLTSSAGSIKEHIIRTFYSSSHAAFTFVVTRTVAYVNTDSCRLLFRDMMEVLHVDCSLLELQRDGHIVLCKEKTQLPILGRRDNRLFLFVDHFYTACNKQAGVNIQARAINHLLCFHMMDIPVHMVCIFKVCMSIENIDLQFKKEKQHYEHIMEQPYNDILNFASD